MRENNYFYLVNKFRIHIVKPYMQMSNCKKHLKPKHHYQKKVIIINTMYLHKKSKRTGQ